MWEITEPLAVGRVPGHELKDQCIDLIWPGAELMRPPSLIHLLALLVEMDSCLVQNAPPAHQPRNSGVKGELACSVTVCHNVYSRSL